MTIRLAGHDDGNPTDRWSTGLIIDHQPIITNKHVISGLAETSTGMSIYPRRDDPDARRVDCSGTGAAHATIDVAVISGASCPTVNSFRTLRVWRSAILTGLMRSMCSATRECR